MKHKPNPSPSPQNLDSPPLAGGGRGRGSARKSGHAVQEEGALSPSPLAGEGWGEGAASEPRVVSEGPITPYLAKPQQPRHSREGGNLEAAVKQWPFDQAAIAQSDRGRRMKQRDYQEGGAIPVIDQGQEFVGGYTDDQQMAYDGELPVVLFGDHTRSVKFVDQPFAVGADGIKIFRPAQGLLPKYFYYWMKSARLPDRGYGRHYQFLRKLSVPVPHPDEQRRIVAELETQLTRLDAGVTPFKRVQANLKRYRASVLKAACEGRLVPTEAELGRGEGRPYESGAELLARILKERRCQWEGGNYKEPAAPTAATSAAAVEGWTWATIQQLALKVVDGTHHTPTYLDSGVAFISVKDIRGGRVYFDDCKFISAVAHTELSKRCHVELGDVLITKSGTIGRIAIVKTDRPFSLFVSVALIKPVQKIFDARFLALSLEKHIAGINIDQDIKGGLLKNLHLEDLRVIAIRLPPIAEQYRIVAEVERRLSVIEELEVAVAANLKRAERLRQSVLARAFAPAP